jgi:hypothetical protein
MNDNFLSYYKYICKINTKIKSYSTGNPPPNLFNLLSKKELISPIAVKMKKKKISKMTPHAEYLKWKSKNRRT